MPRRSRFVLGALTAAIGCGAALRAPTAFAQVVEPNGIPVPVAHAFEINLQPYFDGVNEGIDALADAAPGPGAFSPLCDFDATLVLSQGHPSGGIGWYNVPANPMAPVPLADVNIVVPPGTPVNTVINAGDIRASAAYTGGFIGFALLKEIGGTQVVYYSEYQRNAFCSGCVMPDYWKMTLVYRSTLDISTFYLAFEDWEGANATTWQGNDGDFNDKVFRLHGISCAGGGMPCTVEGKLGRCAAGLTECQMLSGGPPVCKQQVEEQDEVCDDVDNDCNGEVDDGELCAVGEVCVRGTCVGACNTGEFQCPAEFACQNGYCIDPRCVGVECMAGQVCRAGECVDACSGIVCPIGQSCLDGRCLDACAGVDCPDGTLCDRGVCIGTCACTGCPPPTGGEPQRLCAPDGRCVAPGCETVTCAQGEACVAGACVDACLNAQCPGGASCLNGICGEPTGTGGGAGTGAGGVAQGGSAGAFVGGGNSAGGSGGTVASGGSGAQGGEARELGGAKGDPGCACRAGGRKGGAFWGVAVVALTALLFRRRARELGAL